GRPGYSEDGMRPSDRSRTSSSDPDDTAGELPRRSPGRRSIYLVHFCSRRGHFSLAFFSQFFKAAEDAASMDFRTAPPQAAPLSGVASAAHIFGGTPNRTLQLSEPQSRCAASLAFCWVGSSQAKPDFRACPS